ncbi:MAG TPA: hypothetical protein VGO40_08365 [Longimicrobium sp.]|jgi:hypothetical protein|nr:hypothetical protein [Longimicrobium sp.]
MRTPADFRALAALLALVAAPAAAQAPARPVATDPAAPAAAPAAALPAADVYRREVFRYQRGGRPDPFQPLLTAAELGFRVEDLRLTAIIYSPGNRSVAVFAAGDSARRYRLHPGQRMGTMTVLRILPNRVDVRVDEFGGSHLQSIPLVRAERIQQQAAQAAGAAPQPQLPVTFTPAPPAPQAPRVLRRGPAPAAAPPPAAPAVSPRPPTYTSGTRPR